MRDRLAELLAMAFIILFIAMIVGFPFASLAWYLGADDSNSQVASSAAPSSDEAVAGAPADVEVTEAAEVESLPDFSGTYTVTARVTGGNTYTTQVQIGDLGDGRIELGASYEGIPLNFVGTPTKKLSPSGGTWAFSPRVPLLFQGTASITLAYKDGAYNFSGSGSGTYFKGFTMGQGSGTASGRQIGAATTAAKSGGLNSLDKSFKFAASSNRQFPTPSPINAGAAAAAAGGAAAAAGIASASGRRRLRITAPSSATGSSPNQKEGEV